MSFRMNNPTRRRFLGTASALGCTLAAPALAQTDASDPNAVEEEAPVRRVMMGFRAHDWRDYFDNLDNGAILCDTSSRALHYWSEDESIVKIYPTSVPLSEDLTRLGAHQGDAESRRTELGADPLDERAQPRMARPHRPGAGQSAGQPCAVSVLAVLPDPWHPRHAQDRPSVVEWLHRPL